MKTIIVLVAAAAVGAGAFLYPWRDDGKAGIDVKKGELFTVRRDDLDITITENGTVVAKESQKVISKIRGEGKITFLVEEGKAVEQGEVVCRLDTTALEAQIEQVQLDILQTESGLKTAKTEYEIQVTENAANVAKAKATLDKAQKELEKYRDGEAPQERRKLEVAIKDTETEFNRAQKNLSDSEKLLEQNYIKKAELEDHQIAFEKATVQKEGAELALRIFDKYTSPMMMTDLTTKLSDAERDVTTVTKRAESTLGQKEVAVQQYEKRLKMQTTQLTEKKQDLANMTLTAPCPGIVVYGDPHEPWYREQTKVGGTIYGSHTVMTIPDLRVMQVKLQIHEADIDKVKVGQGATVTMDTYPGVVLHGEITKIATIAGGDNPWNRERAEVKKFDAEITLKSEPAVSLKPGLSAKAEIRIEKRPKVLFIPLQCVFAESGESFCHVLEKGKGPARRKVKIGPSSDNFIEIVDGLAAGEEVLLYNPSLPTGDAPKTEEPKPSDDKSKEPPAPDEPAAGRSP